MVMDGYGWLWMVTEHYHWLWTVLSMVIDGCLVFPMVVNGCMSSCAGSQEKNWLLHWMYSMLLQCIYFQIIMIYF